MSHSISAVIPVYDVEQYLDACLDSIVNQTAPFYEIILVDDGSTDSSGRLCDLWRERDNRIKVIHQENGGLSVARNTGIETATGDYLLFVDSDDTIDLDSVERFNEVFKERQPDLIVANLRVVAGKDITHMPHVLSNSQTALTGKDYLKREYATQTMRMASVQCLYRRQFLLKNGIKFEPGLLHEDELFTPFAFFEAKSVIPTDIEFYNHMMREGSITTAKNKRKNAESIIKICYLLEEWTKTIHDKELASQIMEHCVDLYYKVFVDADLSSDELRIRKGFLKQHGKKGKNKIRRICYGLNKRLFSFVEKNRRKLK